jgi:peptidoglycan/LPS O-acetylase OafA/YrhL
MWEWSLFSEAIFYLIFPILFLIIKNNTKLLTLLIFSLIIFIFITSYNNKLYNIPLVSMYSFMLWLTLFKVKNYTISPYKLKYLAIFNLLLYIILPPITLYIKQNFIDLSFQVLYPIMFLNLSLTTFLFIKWKYDIKNKILIKFFKFTWQISYSLYLQNMLFLTWFWHIFNKFIFNVYQHNLFIEIILFLLTIWMLFTTSFLTYKFIEQPWIKLGKKIIEKNLN